MRSEAAELKLAGEAGEAGVVSPDELVPVIPTIHKAHLFPGRFRWLDSGGKLGGISA